MKDGDIIQIAHVVRDLDKAMKYYWETFGLGPWNIYTFNGKTVRDSMVRGKASDHEYFVAVTWSGGTQFELMQPIRGRSIYDEHLEKKGEGLHHIKFYYKDCDAALKAYKEMGVEVIQSGRIDDDVFYYLDTEESLGYTAELGNGGAIREPERRYPADSQI